jgi:hypothetical protein
MRKVMNEQMKIGEVPISEIVIDLKSRDDIPKVLAALKHIYCTPEIKEEVFEILETVIPKGINKNNGRPGMEIWKILVLGILRLACDMDYDRLLEQANHHDTIRKILGHNDEFGCIKEEYCLQTVKDNISLFTPEILDKISQVVVKAGHNLVKKKKKKYLGNVIPL